MHIEIKKVCVPTDFSDQSSHAIKYAVGLAKQFSSQLHVVHVIQEILPTVPEPGLAILPTDEIMKNLEAGAKEGLKTCIPSDWAGSLDIVRVTRNGVPYQEICKYCHEQDVDLIVMGTHGRTGLAHLLLGSVAERVVRAAPCPVLTVRDPEHEFILED